MKIRATDSPHAAEPASKLSLRRKAEAHFRERESLSPKKLDSLSQESLQTILHELRVHQIELEMQNEDLRQAQELLDVSRARYFDLYDLAPAGYMTVGEEGVILEANLTAARLLGMARSALVNLPLSRLIFREDQDVYYRCRQRLFEAGEPQEFELRLEKEDGSIFWAQVLAAPSPGPDGTPAFRALLSDITGRKSLERELADALLHSREAAAAKSDFLGMMSHELRTPLNGVLGFTELLADTPLNDDQKSFAKTISASGEHLLAIVNDILDFSSIEHGSLAIQAAPFSISNLVESSDVAIRQAAAEKGITFHCEVAAGVPDHATGDVRRIRQVLINLLGNALKFTEAGSVVLRIAPGPAGGTLEFSVEDTGIGISAGTLACLFKPFSQANSTTSRPFGGTGLGLAISKRLAEAMGGSIRVESNPGQGSTFTFRLPLEFPAPVPAGECPADKNAAPPTNTLVLVAEDDPNSSALAGKMLESLGYRAAFAADGAEAVKAFVSGKFAAILMDMAMPVMDGLEATKKIRSGETGSRVPIIALTANVMPGDRERCLDSGMDGFLAKPYRKSDLAAVLAGTA